VKAQLQYVVVIIIVIIIIIRVFYVQARQPECLRAMLVCVNWPPGDTM
jgi:uncharacterized integral membrane protein